MSTTLPQASRRFGDLRGVQWRIDLGILPSSADPSIHNLRRVTADFRRRCKSWKLSVRVSLEMIWLKVKEKIISS